MRCLICKNSIDTSSPASMAHRPFCSARCKTIDLAKWLTEDYRIPTMSAEDDEDGQTPANPSDEN